MSLRTKFGLTEVNRMDVKLASSVSAAVKSALVEGDWVKLTSASAASGVPASAGGIELTVVPVEPSPTDPSRLSYPIICNPQSPEQGVPGVGLTVACDKGFIGYTDRFNPGLGAAAYTNVPLVAEEITVSGVKRYGLLPADTTADTGDVARSLHVAWGITVLNGELIFRYLP